MGLIAYVKKFDAGVARGEAAVAATFLLFMILVASLQAILRNLAGIGVPGMNDVLGYLTWVDPFLQKGTLWLAFLGASLATREGRHIGIDLFPRIAPRVIKLIMRAIASIWASGVSFYLARAFWAAVLLNAEERPAHMEAWSGMNQVHVCDATAEEVAAARNEVPEIFCAVRDALEVIDVPVSTPWAALQLIVPVMFVFIAIRLFFNGIGAGIRLATGAPAEDEEEKGRTSIAPAAAAASSEGDRASADAEGDSSEDDPSEDDAAEDDSSEGAAPEDEADEDDPSEDAAGEDDDEAKDDDADDDPPSSDASRAEEEE